LHESGIKAIGVYSENDRDSQWIRFCDHSWTLGSGSVADTYLNSEKIIQIALRSGADAIHPGYGFLSENFRFAEACEKNNLIFIGPDSHTLKIAGDKQASNDVARELGIPAIDKITGQFEVLLSKSSDLKYPVIAKAVAGGGGRGIRLVRNQSQLSDILKIVSDEALISFGDDRIYLEEYIENPRHIEIQILCDVHGNKVHLFERECSVQRRHQKLIEETPAPGISSTLRKALTDASLRIADKLNFISAGTIEFLVDRDENYWFLEINPRIQVEHGITEMVTGIDIIKEQIAIAQGDHLTVRQEQIFCRGHATEVRIYSEDPENNMIPLPGIIQSVSFPSADHLRIDTAIEPNSEIVPDFDPLLA
jgi:acetyl/propionyl-CoA carboxylase alpha subunit